MNIIHVHPYFSFEKCFHSRYLIHEQAKLGNVVDVISSREDKYKVINLGDNLRVHLLPSINMPFPRNVANPLLLNLKKHIQNLKPDIIHFHQLFKITALTSIITSKVLDLPTVSTIHGVIATSSLPLEIAQRVYYYTIGKEICKATSKIHCLTESDAMDMIQFGCPPKKIEVIPNGVDTEKFKPEREGLENILYWGGRFVPQKGLDYLIHAIQIVVKKKPNARLVMSGRGPQFSKILNKVKRYGLSKNVIFKGQVPFDEIPKLLNSASIYVLPSIMEGMPYALLEAMACGRPVIASNIPGIKDVITNEENGILIPTRDPVALANAILRLMEDHSLRLRLGKNARQLMIENYDWRIIAEKMEKVYNEVTENRASHSTPNLY